MPKIIVADDEVLCQKRIDPEDTYGIAGFSDHRRFREWRRGAVLYPSEQGKG